jgi:hypothetical protein
MYAGNLGVSLASSAWLWFVCVCACGRARVRVDPSLHKAVLNSGVHDIQVFLNNI